MEIRVLRRGFDDHPCAECGADAETELELYDEPERFAALCLGCLILELLRLRALFQIRRTPVGAAAGAPPGS